MNENKEQLHESEEARDPGKWEIGVRKGDIKVSNIKEVIYLDGDMVLKME